MPGERNAWSSLLRSNPDCRRAFLSPGFAEAAARCGNEVWVAAGYRGEEPHWFMPLQRHGEWIGRLGVFEPVGGGMSDYFGAIGVSGSVIVPEHIFSASGGRIAAILFTHLDESQAGFGLRAGEPRVGLRTHIGDSAETYWADLRRRDKKLVYDTERREKKLMTEHGKLCFEWHSSEASADLQKLVEMKTAQYAKTGKHGGPLFHKHNVDLLERLLNTADDACEGVLSVLRSGNEIVAAHFGLRCHDVLHIWFPAYAVKFANYSPGRILLKHIIRHAAEHGVHTLDRGEGDTVAKRDFANGEHRYFRGLWHAMSPRGLLARVAVSLYWRL
ncbi:MAG: GNAT family N-acetyltransferase [Candidatus Accumulibacter sp.]|nr:GNAT family N-acetyltransferase [Accumulibacter sp.]